MSCANDERSSLLIVHLIFVYSVSTAANLPLALRLVIITWIKQPPCAVVTHMLTARSWRLLRCWLWSRQLRRFGMRPGKIQVQALVHLRLRIALHSRLWASPQVSSRSYTYPRRPHRIYRLAVELFRQGRCRVSFAVARRGSRWDTRTELRPPRYHEWWVVDLASIQLSSTKVAGCSKLEHSRTW